MERIFRHLPPKPRPVAVLTATFVGVCVLVAMELRGKGGQLGFFVLLPAIFLASVLFGRGAGLFATGLSTLSLYALATPRGSLLPPPGLPWALVLFVLIAILFAVVSDGLRAALDRAAAAERAKDLLLQELGHRTKNNLAMVVSVLSLQARLKTDPDMKRALEKAVARVEAIASAHEHVQHIGHSGAVQMRSYLERLCSHLGDALRDVRPIAVRVEADEVYLSAERAIPVGLIVNELVTNSFKYAFPGGRAGVVEVVLRREDSVVKLVVSDDGIGCSADQPTGLGSRLVQLLARQLGASIAQQGSASGYRIVLLFSPD